jgi:hypothetical protein
VVKIVVERKREVEPVAAEEVEVVAAAGAVEEGTKEESSAETE